MILRDCLLWDRMSASMTCVSLVTSQAHYLGFGWVLCAVLLLWMHKCAETPKTYLVMFVETGHFHKVMLRPTADAAFTVTFAGFELVWTGCCSDCFKPKQKQWIVPAHNAQSTRHCHHDAFTARWGVLTCHIYKHCCLMQRHLIITHTHTNCWHLLRRGVSILMIISHFSFSFLWALWASHSQEYVNKMNGWRRRWWGKRLSAELAVTEAAAKHWFRWWMEW